MATHVGSRFYVKVASTVAGTSPNSGSRATNIEINRAPATGTTDGQWDLGGGKTFTATTTPASIDLRSYTPQDAASAQVIVDADLIIAECPSTNTAKVTLSVGASNGFTGVITSGGVDIYPGGCFIWHAPASSVSTGGSTKTLDYVAASGSQSLTFTVFGRSA